jgi:hypothetical protein
MTLWREREGGGGRGRERQTDKEHLVERRHEHVRAVLVKCSL